MQSAVLIGVVSALILSIPGIIQHLSHEKIFQFPWGSPYWILMITAIVTILQRSIFERRGGWRINGGLADLLVHIHTPSSLDSSFRWLMKGSISALLAVFGGFVGMEGAAIEYSHAFAIFTRGRFLRWFEQRRRTDAACVLASGIAASFDAPFAGILLPIELRIGGQSISAAISSITALLVIKGLGQFIPMKRFDLGGLLFGFGFNDWKDWLSVLIIASIAGLCSVIFIGFLRYIQECLSILFRHRIIFRTITVGVLVFAVGYFYEGGLGFPSVLLEELLWSKKDAIEVGVLFLSKFLCLSLILSSFGSVGVFWPIFALGGFLGFAINYYLLGAIISFSGGASLIGGAAFIAAALGTPVSAGILCFEMSQNLQILFPCLIAGFVARGVADKLSKVFSLAKDFHAFGLPISEGRSSEVLKSICVRDAMVMDFEVIKETQSVAGLKDLLLKSKYPFLPVVHENKKYLGLLTIDMVQESHSRGPVEFSHSSLSSLLEVRDLIYRYGFKSPLLKPDDPLDFATGLFEKFPCIPVLDPQEQVIGLLFSSNVRMAYDREVARQSLLGGRRSLI